MTRTMLIVPALLAACTFPGEQGNLQFGSNLSTPTHAFAPAQDAVAVGSTVEFRAIVPDGNPAQAKPSLDDAACMTGVEAGVDVFRGVLARDCSATLRWDGALSDDFTLTSRVATGGALEDPLRTLSGGRWAAPGASVVMVPGSSLYLEVQLTGADGGTLTHSPGSVWVGTKAQAIAARSVGAGVVLSAAADGGEAPEVAWRYLDRVSGRFAVRTAEPREIDSLELIGSSEGRDSQVALKATARLKDGATLWQAPIEWSYDEHLQPLDVSRYTEAYSPRPDVLVLQLTGGAASLPADADGYWTTEIRARAGSATAVYKARLRVAPPSVTAVKPPARETLGAGAESTEKPTPESSRQPAQSSCGCGACDAGGILLLLLVLLMFKAGGSSSFG